MWKIHLCNKGLLKALKGTKPEDMKEDDWEERKAKTVNIIRLSLMFEVKYNVFNKTSSSKLWKKIKKKVYIYVKLYYK